MNRLKLLEKKKTELALKARKEIADYIGDGKAERARIRVEHIIVNFKKLSYLKIEFKYNIFINYLFFVLV